MPEKTIWDIISSVSAVIAAIVALVTVIIAIKSLQKERHYKRPYFTIEKPGIKKLGDSPPFRIQITMLNMGVHPAKDLTGKLRIFDQALENAPEFNFDFSIANEIPHESPTPWYNDGLMLPDNVSPKYVTLEIKYYDPLLKEHYPQAFYMKWDGVKNGSTHPDFVHVSIEESDKIKDYLKKQISISI